MPLRVGILAAAIVPWPKRTQLVPQEKLRMIRRSGIWFVVAVLFSVVNAAGAVFAAARWELRHAGVHVALALLGAYAAWWLASSSSARGRWRRREAASPATPGELSERLTNLEHAVDAVAIEIERIGEGQRYITRSFTGNASPTETDSRRSPDG